MVVEEKSSYSPAGSDKSMHLSFSGCGFLGLYHVGVVSCIKEYAPHLANGKIAGASAGALAACGLVTDCNLGDATSYVLSVALKARSRALGPLHPSFNIVKYLRDGMEVFLPPDAHIKASGHLYVSLTRVSDGKNVLVSQFDTREDLIEAIICSAFVPFYCGVIPPKFKGVRYIDGGISDNLPDLGPDTVTVSPFAGETDICPRDYSANWMQINIVNTSIQLSAENFYRFSRALFPPHPEVLSRMCRQGFDDCLNFLQRNTPQKVAQVEADFWLQEEQDSEENSTSCSVSSDWSEFDDDLEISESDDECADCQQDRNAPLPSAVLSALQVACDSVNSGLLSSLYDSKAFHALSLMTAPWLLPLDLVIVLGQKFLDWMPHMSGDVQWFVHELIRLLQEVFQNIQSERHRYSASFKASSEMPPIRDRAESKFSCQLAITEVNFQEDHSGSATPGLFHSPAHLSRGNPEHSHHSKSLNFGFSLDFQTSKTQAPISRVKELRHRMLADDEHVEVKRLAGSTGGAELPVEAVAKDLKDISEAQARHVPSHRASHTLSHTTDRPASIPVGKPASHRQPLSLDPSYDTFENCLHITDQMDALLSFYYMEENDPGVVRVTEIFPLSDPRGPKPSFNASDLASNGCMTFEPGANLHACRSKQVVSPPLSRSLSVNALENRAFNFPFGD